MITGREPTPQQRIATGKRNKTTMIFYAVAALVWVVLGVLRIKQGSASAISWFALGEFALAIAYGFMAWRTYRILRQAQDDKRSGSGCASTRLSMTSNGECLFSEGPFSGIPEHG